jgi:NAD(P) transhydrogenase subunit beta
MDIPSASVAAFLVAALLFVLTLAGLARHESAKLGNYFGMLGMAVALVATTALAFDGGVDSLGAVLLVVAVILGATIGLTLARKVEMTGMPELIALLHSFVGLAAVLVGWNGYLHVENHPGGHESAVLDAAGLLGIHSAEVFIGVFIGAVTFTGSIVAYLKLSARIKSAPLVLPGKNVINLGALVVFAALTVWFVIDPQLWLLIVITILALALGWHLVASIGGGDMPVVVSMLNSYSGWAAAASGFLLNNNLLIIVGALVGSSGAYLSYIMCKAMNRSFISVIAGGFGVVAGPADDVDYGEHREIQADAVAELLAGAKSVVITPGYGMAVVQAHYPVADLTTKLRARGIDVRFGIHPGRGAPTRSHERVAGRGEGALRHRPGDGRDQRRLPRDRRGPRHRRQRHRQPVRGRGPLLRHRWDAGARGVECQGRDRVQALHGRLRRGAEPPVLPRQQPDAVR